MQGSLWFAHILGDAGETHNIQHHVISCNDNSCSDGGVSSFNAGMKVNTTELEGVIVAFKKNHVHSKSLEGKAIELINPNGESYQRTHSIETSTLLSASDLDIQKDSHEEIGPNGESNLRSPSAKTYTLPSASELDIQKDSDEEIDR